ncbi:hypothetical protein K435DRAFT_871277 [Dendrothele bispora CBS 962.96]|uniref:Uncharacterized protein n=1 Tax=Dendrothele bispora (strain CBS 962.96) TaxID=1314807 RepID=A0A4S8L4Y2_DENBC|nr:hypothetical protein K435DRAFT_871277 [Dendrothele bispora CBS 962.96]
MEADGLLPDLPASPKLDNSDREREHVKAKKETRGRFNGPSPERSGRERVGMSSVAPSDPVHLEAKPQWIPIKSEVW